MDDRRRGGLAVVKRFLDGEGAAIEGQGNQPLTTPPRGRHEGLRADDRPDQAQDRRREGPIDALGFNSTWPGPRLDVVEGDKVRAVFTNNLDESTGIHFHGQKLPNNMDGVPHVTQDPIQPGASFTYEFTAGRPARTCTTRTTTRPTRSAEAAGRVHRPPPRRGRPGRAEVRREPGHRLDQQRLARRVHDQRPRLRPRRRSSRTSATGS